MKIESYLNNLKSKFENDGYLHLKSVLDKKNLNIILKKSLKFQKDRKIEKIKAKYEKKLKKLKKQEERKLKKIKENEKQVKTELKKIEWIIQSSWL